MAAMALQARGTQLVLHVNRLDHWTLFHRLPWEAQLGGRGVWGGGGRPSRWVLQCKHSFLLKQQPASSWYEDPHINEAPAESAAADEVL